MTGRGQLFVVGVGPGHRDLLTPQAATALRQADVVIGYAGYFAWVLDLIQGKEWLALPLGQEKERAQAALEHARQGRQVALISSGDPGIYAMASLVLEMLADVTEAVRPEVVVLPGVSALTAAAALLGAPLGHDFAAISLSDLLTHWEVIEKRVIAAAGADFVLALFNPRSRRRDWQLDRARQILLSHRAGSTPVGIVRHATRPGQDIVVTTLAEMDVAKVDMFSIVIVGNSTSRFVGNFIMTPRGYEIAAGQDSNPDVDKAVTIETLTHQEKRSNAPRKPEDILTESFRIIEDNVGQHAFNAVQWPIVRRMIHASGDLDLVNCIRFHNDPVPAALEALVRHSPIVTDVTMVQAGIHHPSAAKLGVPVRCFLNDPGVEQKAKQLSITRSACGLEQATTELKDAIYVIGNAPTALLTLCAAVREKRVRPALIVAMPVGFVAVAESKEEALRLPVPVITVLGRKGGSALAAATVNALLDMAMKGSQA